MAKFAGYAVNALLLGAFLVGYSTVFAAQSKSAAGETYKYDTPATKLEGTLLERKVYGPPGYGEMPKKDARETILILKLPHPIAVVPAPNAVANGSFSQDRVKNIREVQLFLSHNQTWNIKTLLGSAVIATGTLNESVTASQRTKVWLSVQKLDSK